MPKKMFFGIALFNCALLVGIITQGYFLYQKTKKYKQCKTENQQCKTEKEHESIFKETCKKGLCNFEFCDNCKYFIKECTSNSDCGSGYTCQNDTPFVGYGDQTSSGYCIQEGYFLSSTDVNKRDSSLQGIRIINGEEARLSRLAVINPMQKIFKIPGGRPLRQNDPCFHNMCDENLYCKCTNCDANGGRPVKSLQKTKYEMYPIIDVGDNQKIINTCQP